MGMFNSIIADPICPKRNRVSADTEIQIKWQSHDVLALTNYRCGDFLEEIEPEFNNVWIRTDFICNICSAWSVYKDGEKYISTDGQKRHFVFIRIEDGRISEIISFKDFRKRKIQKFITY